MTELLRAEYTDHSQSIQTLLDTGDAGIICDLDSASCVAGRKWGTDRIGRVLDVICSHPTAAAAGIPPSATHEIRPSAAS